jgi:DNA-binding transcriptional MerR regulator
MSYQESGHHSLHESGGSANLFRIGEVSRLTDTKPFVLRYWETEFPMLQPVKSPKGHRLYRQEDVNTVLTIKRLLYDEGFTIAGARRHLHEGGGLRVEVSGSYSGAQPGPARHMEADSRSSVAMNAAPAVPVAESSEGVSADSADTEQNQLISTEPDLSNPRVDAQEADGVPPEASEATQPGIPTQELSGGRRRTETLASIDRVVLFELRDALRSFLTLLENE